MRFNALCMASFKLKIMIYIKEPRKGQKVTINHPLGQNTYLIDDKIKTIDDCIGIAKESISSGNAYNCLKNATK